MGSGMTHRKNASPAKQKGGYTTYRKGGVPPEKHGLDMDLIKNDT